MPRVSHYYFPSYSVYGWAGIHATYEVCDLHFWFWFLIFDFVLGKVKVKTMTITKKQSFVDEHDDEHDNEYDNNDVDDRSLESSFESVDSSSSVSSSFSDNTSITPASSSTTISSFNYSSSAKGTGRRIKRKTDEGLVGGLLSFKEERAVVSARWSFLFLLLAAAAVVGTVVYVVMKKEEEEDFESQVSFVVGSWYVCVYDVM